MFAVFAATSRYAQEARPYAIEMLVSVWCWREWHRTQIADDASRRWRYSLSIVVLAIGHVLGLVQVVGQLVAAIALRTPLRRMAAPAGAGLVVAAPWAVLSAVRGTGPVQIPVPYTIPHIAATFLGMLTANNRGWLAGVIILALAALGAAHLLRQARPLAIMAVCWAAVAPVLLVLLAIAEPALLQRRYWLSSLPGWAILAGAGVVYLSRLAARHFTVLVAHVVAVGTVLVVAVVQLPTQLTIRGPGGHGDDIRPVVAAVQLPRYRALPIAFGEYSGPLVLTQYAPALTSRVLDWQLPTTGAAVWPNHEPTRAVVRSLRHDKRVLVVLRDADVGTRPLSRRAYRELLLKQVPNAVRTSGFDRFRSLSQRSSWVLLLAMR
jgi:mannosyltransferase